MKILVTFAVVSEFAPWRRLRPFDPIKGRRELSWRTRIAGAEVSAVLTGVGPENARRAMAQALEEHPDLCISSGLAGGLRREHSRGAVLVAEQIRDGKTHRLVHADSAWIALAEREGAERVPSFYSSADLVITAEGKARLGRIANAVEMESYEVLSAALERGVPAVCIRAISDTVDENLPLDFSGFLDAQGQLRYSRLVAGLALGPRKIPAVLRLGAACRKASGRLAGVLDSFAAAAAARPEFAGRTAEAVPA